MTRMDLRIETCTRIAGAMGKCAFLVGSIGLVALVASGDAFDDAVGRTLPVPLVPAPKQFVERPGKCTAGGARVVHDASVPTEGYRISVASQGVEIRCSDAAGEFYARQTLAQLCREEDGASVWPCCEIEDAPAFRWRGVHWDDSRHFFGKAAVKRALDLMARHKFNVFHWHLTDNQGWRLPIERYPEMTDRAARRPYSKDHRHLLDEKPEGTPGEYGPFAYTKDEIREVVAYAKARFIRVIPEVEIPGHARSTFYAHPELLCFADDPAARPTNAVDNVYCVGNPKTYEFLENVLDEVCRLFPDPVVHIGGDEVNKTNWMACPKCRARMKELGVATPEELQAKVNGHFADYLVKRGRQAIWWGEIPERDVPKNLKVMSWLGAECGIAAAKKGIEAVMCEHTYTCFDYSPCVKDDVHVYPWFTERLPISKVYAYDPLKGIPAGFHKYILGGECCNWSEYTCTEADLDWKLWMRACALAEVLWTGPARPGYEDFRRRMEVHRKRLLAQGVNCAPET